MNMQNWLRRAMSGVFTRHRSKTIEGRCVRPRVYELERRCLLDVQGSKLARQGAEDVFIQGFKEQGATLTNVDEALSFANQECIQRALAKIEAYIEDLVRRGLRK